MTNPELPKATPRRTESRRKLPRATVHVAQDDLERERAATKLELATLRAGVDDDRATVAAEVRP